MSGRADRRRGAPSPGDRLHRQRGSGTVLVLGWMAVLMALALGVAAATMLLAVRHRTEAAADLAALTAATHVSEDAGSSCRSARRIAASMSSTVRRCTVDGARVALDLEGTRMVVGHRFVVSAHAEAGPVTSDE